MEQVGLHRPHLPYLDDIPPAFEKRVALASMAALGALLLRRDTNRVRRAGIGRQTTKRTFHISLPAPGLFLGSARGTKRNSKTLEDEAKQRMAAGEEGPGSGIPSDLPLPNSEAAFRRTSKLMRTPSGGASLPRADEADEQEISSGGVAPVMRIPFGEDGPSSGAPPPPPADEEEVLRRSMGTSPLNFAGESAEEVLRRSMGTSPLAPDTAIFGGTLATQTSPDAMEQQDNDDDAHIGFDEQPDWDDAPGSGPSAMAELPVEAAPETAKPTRKNGGKRTRKTSLDRLGRNPTAGPSTGGATTEPAMLDNNGGRSRRQRFRPLEFWRNERVIYGRRNSAKFEAIVDVVVAEREPTPPHFRRQNKKGGASSKPSTALVVAADPVIAADQLAGAVDALADPVPAADPLADAVDAFAPEDGDGDDTLCGKAAMAAMAALAAKSGPKRVKKVAAKASLGMGSA